jgi:hypothetical protein
MTRDELDTMWQQALHESVVAGENFIRYHFAKLVAEAEGDKHNTGSHTCSDRCQRYACVAVREAVAAEREACAMVCDEVECGAGMMIEERHTANECAKKIRARGEVC